jgi:hypothetical protein
MTFACVPGFELRTTASAAENIFAGTGMMCHYACGIYPLSSYVKTEARARLATRTSLSFHLWRSRLKLQYDGQEELLKKGWGSAFGIMRYDEKEHEGGRGLRLSVESNISLEGNSLMDPLYGWACKVSEHRGGIRKYRAFVLSPLSFGCHPLLGLRTPPFYSIASNFSHSFFFF